MKCAYSTKSLLISIVLLLVSSTKAEAAAIARRGCKDTCGDVSIPFPWGIGSTCFLDQWFEIKCREVASSHHSNTTKLPFLAKLGVEVMEINLDGDVIIRMPPMSSCTKGTLTTDLKGSPYIFSSSSNAFVLEGCSGVAILVDESQPSNTTEVGCATFCLNNNDTETELDTIKCLGLKCCYYPLIHDLQSYKVRFYRQDGDDQSCLLASLVMTDRLDKYVIKLSGGAPVALTWSWISNTKPDFNPWATCVFNGSGSWSWSCSCKEDHNGSNPYVNGGCQVPKNCKACPGSCKLDAHSFRFACPIRTRSYYFSSRAVVDIYRPLAPVVLIVLVLLGTSVCVCISSRSKTQRRVKFFKLMLQKHQSSSDGAADSTKLFTYKELDKATEHFNDNRVLGKGGQGTVYRGMLNDGKIVAVKRSVKMDETQMYQFINEVVILSQTNHRNVVKLLGCCLEKEVPLLAYEYISNGTLQQHLQNPSEYVFLPWDMRLKIALDSAGAIAYLHSSSSTPVYHRDIKSANILLDDKFRAKVSDFGISKTLEIDQTHATTLVQGTFGYLDPEYFESSVFTEKSDVYSFGVVLLELLTSKKPIFRDEEMEPKGLAPEFLIHMQNQTLSSILDPEVVKDAREEEIAAYADLAKRCLNYSGRLRPTMREVAMTLEMIIKPPDQTHTQGDESSEDEGFDEIVMSDAELKSSSARVGTVSSFYFDVAPLLHDTI